MNDIDDNSLTIIFKQINSPHFGKKWPHEYAIDGLAAIGYNKDAFTFDMGTATVYRLHTIIKE